jgi:hypothetical protein
LAKAYKANEESKESKESKSRYEIENIKYTSSSEWYIVVVVPWGGQVV